MKKVKIFSLLGLGLLALTGIGLATAQNIHMVAKAEGEESSEVSEEISAEESSLESVSEEASEEVSSEEQSQEEVFECKVIIAKAAHGSVTVDKTEGHVGDIVTIKADAELFYLVETMKVNGTDLVESEEEAGTYMFALVEGENTITAKFVVDKELLGEFSTIYEQIQNGDWTQLFSVRNIITVVSFLLSSGLLIAMVRYYVRDKKIEKKLEQWVKDTLNKMLPDTTKKAVTDCMREILLPFFEEYFADWDVKMEDMENSMIVFSRCMALAQENTPEAKMAITKELSSLKLSDQAAISGVEQKIKQFIEEQSLRMNELIKKMDEMEQHNKEVIAQNTGAEQTAETEGSSEPIPGDDDGTQI